MRTTLFKIIKRLLFSPRRSSKAFEYSKRTLRCRSGRSRHTFYCFSAHRPLITPARTQRQQRRYCYIRCTYPVHSVRGTFHELWTLISTYILTHLGTQIKQNIYKYHKTDVSVKHWRRFAIATDGKRIYIFCRSSL